MKQVCVFCGSSPGSRPEFIQAAQQLGAVLAERSITLVYGGGNVGLMGQIARTARKRGGSVIGVIPQALYDLEVAYKELDDLRVVGSMHERKALMAELSDGFIALPGGFGTIEEFFEALTWSQLGIHTKPCGLLNVEGYFDNLLAFLDDTVAYNFVNPATRKLVLVNKDAGTLLSMMESYKPRKIDKAAWALGLNERM